MIRKCLVLSFLAALWLAGAATATTYVLGPDEHLADQAAVVLEGVVEEVVEVVAAPRPLTEYQVRIERVLKGRVTGADVRVRVLGGPAGDGTRLVVRGAPALAVGERTLLFLVPHADGAFRPLHLGLGVFRERSVAGRALALRDLSEALVLSPQGEEASERARDFAGFSRWLADRAAGLQRPQDYFVELPGGPGKAIAPFTFLGDRMHRWFEFDNGQSVSWRAHQGGQPGVPGGGFAEFQAAMSVWNNDPGSNVRYRYDGTTTASGGFKDDGFDGVNAILFEDPNREIGGDFHCSSPGSGSGVLAVGGAWADEEIVRNGFLVILGADIITNDGVGCWFVSGKRAEQVFGHELGHTLGLGHSCGDEGEPCTDDLHRGALMRATAHPDDRGARLNDDDRAGIAFLYPQTGGGGNKPAAPSGLAATTQSSSAILLAWNDNATNETAYRVERKSGGSGYTEVAQLPANASSFTASGLAAATSYTFRVRARNAGGFSPFSNEAAATTAAAQPAKPAAPANLTVEPALAGQARLAWQDKSSNETNFAIEVTSPYHDGWVEIATAAANAVSHVVSNLDGDVPYTFRVRARNAAGSSVPSNEASFTIPATLVCGTVPADLCLHGGRFRVFVNWKLPGGQLGAATAVPDSDQTGFFWFFDASNIELIVKILDGRPINQAFWTFYGGLSDVEYWVAAIDTTTGDTATYHNSPGNLCGNADVRSFPQGSAAAATAGAGAAEPLVLAEAPVLATTEAACAPGTLCLVGGRFQAEVIFQNGGTTGAGTAVPYGDASGFFWFFSASNIELVVKVLDGRPINGKFWLFYGALSDVEYTIKVTDTQTGAVKFYQNAQGNLCGRADTSAF